VKQRAQLSPDPRVINAPVQVPLDYSLSRWRRTVLPSVTSPSQVRLPRRATLSPWESWTTGAGQVESYKQKPREMEDPMPGKKAGSSGPGKRGRSAVTGRFVKQSTVRRHPNTTVNESTRGKKKCSSPRTVPVKAGPRGR
jgi:hypothetical protein